MKWTKLKRIAPFHDSEFNPNSQFSRDAPVEMPKMYLKRVRRLQEEPTQEHDIRLPLRNSLIPSVKKKVKEFIGSFIKRVDSRIIIAIPPTAKKKVDNFIDSFLRKKGG
jgi:hypothetical protein